MNQAIEQFKKGISEYVEYSIQNAPLDKTVNGIISQIHEISTGVYTYDVKINGEVYKNIKTIGGNCSNNEIVKVLIPQNNFNNIVILKGGDNGGSSTYPVQSVNGKVGTVVLNYSDVGALSSSTQASDIGALSNVLDTTLTSETLAPKAKTVGDKFTELEGLIGDIGDILDEINGEVV